MLNALVESAARLCEADKAASSRPEGDVLQSRSSATAYSSAYRAGIWTLTHSHRAAAPLSAGLCWKAEIVEVPDVLADPEYEAADIAEGRWNRSMLGVPLMREGAPIGVIAPQARSVRPFTDKQISGTTFADQAVIAIENVRLFDEVQERTARAFRIAGTADRDRRGAQGDQPLGVRSASGARHASWSSASRLCRAEMAASTRLHDGNYIYRLTAHPSVRPEYGSE